jgi:arginyl-tRNA synthetase
MIKDEIKEALIKAVSGLDFPAENISVDYPVDPIYGDYSTNIALVAAKKAGKNPRELAEEISQKIRNFEIFDKVEIAGPGFINMWIKNEKFAKTIDLLRDSKMQLEAVNKIPGKKVMVEFAHPNTHKAFHIGHLRNITTGESIVRLLETTGVKVVRANYQGDVGMHIAKAIFGLTMLIQEEKVETKEVDIESSSNEIEKVLNVVRALESRNISDRIALLGEAYANGSKLFEEKGEDMLKIRMINSAIYSGDWGIYQPYEEVYKITRKWSLEYFNLIYKRVYTHFDRLYFESEVYEAGKQNVLDGFKKGIFQKSDGAIIFPGSKYGLHDRVFISSEGNPTYEGKDMGLAPLQHKEYHPDLIIHVLGPEQYGYTRVIFKALDLLFPEDAGKQLHLVYGWVKLKHGKMSSRTGNVILGEWLLDEAKKKIVASYEVKDELAEKIAVGAVKYSFLKVGLNQEIAFDLEESISIQGNSGPYLQYTFARTQSVLRKSHIANVKPQNGTDYGLTPEERDVIRLLTRFPEIVSEAAQRYAPHILCTYLFDLAQAFNLFYQKFPILKAEEKERDFRLLITQSTGFVLQQGLQLLGIHAPEKM